MVVNGKNLFVLGLVGIGLYYAWKAVSGAANAATSAVSAATCAISGGIAGAIVDWTTCSPITVNGNVQFPNGTQVAASSLPVGHDCQGNTFVQYQGGVYQLTGSAGCGVYTTTQIS